jgi:hypothetical protein
MLSNAAPAARTATAGGLQASAGQATLHLAFNLDSAVDRFAPQGTLHAH